MIAVNAAKLGRFQQINKWLCNLCLHSLRVSDTLSDFFLGIY